MNITSPTLAGAVRVAELPGDSVTSFLRMIGAGTGLFDDSVDGGLGLVMSALAGVAAALAVAIVLSVYFRSTIFQTTLETTDSGFVIGRTTALEFHDSVADKDIIGAERNIA